MAYFPSASAVVPFGDAFTRMFTPGMGTPSAVSNTLPEINLSCAHKGPEKKSNKMDLRSKIFFIGLDLGEIGYPIKEFNSANS
jgi:hypothetical protein